MHSSQVAGVVRLLKETSAQMEGGEQEAKKPKWMRKLEAGAVLGQEVRF